MAEILYVGDLDFTNELSLLLSNAGHSLVTAKFGNAMPKFREASYGAVVLDWNSRRDQTTIAAAKVLGLPVIAITSQLIEALDAGEPFADIYLEVPPNAKEVAELIGEMMIVAARGLANAAGA